MKTLVTYDSMFGNTATIAKIIAEASGAKLIRADTLKLDDIKGVDLLVIGSPTQAGQPIVAVQKILMQFPDLKNIKVAAFDTRLTIKWVKIFGYAANRIADKLQKSGGELIVEPKGFLVSSKKGPLLDGETNKAKEWAQKLLQP